MINIYYDPIKAGLEILGVLDEDELSYEYNMLVAFRDIESGRLFWAQDSGCSCPTPFEEEKFVSPDDTTLTEITLESVKDFERSACRFPVVQDERNKLTEKVWVALREAQNKKSASLLAPAK